MDSEKYLSIVKQKKTRRTRKPNVPKSYHNEWYALFFHKAEHSPLVPVFGRRQIHPFCQTAHVDTVRLSFLLVCSMLLPCKVIDCIIRLGGTWIHQTQLCGHWIGIDQNAHLG